MKSIAAIICGSFFLTGIAWASGPGTTNANFLKAGQGVRPISMGETYAALGDGLDTLYWNPAGLVQITSPAISLAHNFWFQDIGTEYLAYGTPLGPFGALGGGLTFLHAGTIDQTIENPDGSYAGIGGKASAADVGFIGTYALKLSSWIPGDNPFKNLLIGASLHIVNESIVNASIFGGGLDIGAIWRETEEIKVQDSNSEGGINLKSATRDRGLRFGIIAQNLGATTENLMPIDFRGGLGYVFQEVFSDTGRATIAADVLVPIDNTIKISLGGEYANVSQNTEFALRAGYKIGNEIQDLDSSAGFTAGVGFAIRAGLIKYGIDYAFVPYGILGVTHRVAITLGFLAGENPVRYVAPDNGMKARRRVETLSIAPALPATTMGTKAAAPAKPQTAAELTMAPAGEAATFEAPANPVAELRQALERLQKRINSGLLAGIEFKRGETQVIDSSQKTVDQIGRLIERYPDTAIMINGFDADRKIAEERAKSVARYITMTFRISPDRVSTRAGDPAKQPKNTMLTFDVSPLAK